MNELTPRERKIAIARGEIPIIETPTPPKVEVTEERLRAAWDKWVDDWIGIEAEVDSDDVYGFFKKELGL